MKERALVQKIVRSLLEPRTDKLSGLSDGLHDSLGVSQGGTLAYRPIGVLKPGYSLRRRPDRDVASFARPGECALQATDVA